ncbi:hypothetical protein [Marinobacterium arenosum]|uniref:hypothetical protein n=1 Tax=Marinobacterium arenosum TaxID=2862496 RepID=UPI001C94AD8E|nr:hypothetical protein [Marinobacterium arenosum]MBY4676966.1 hypothetical protein [Marinobacterium arenosum]
MDIRKTEMERTSIALFSATTLLSFCLASWPTNLTAGDAATGLRGVPLRWCAVQGSPAVTDPGGVGESSTNDVLWRRHERPSDNFWIPGANITFRSGFAVKDLTTDQIEIIGGINFPIIDDVNISAGSQEGDIELNTTEQEETLAKCREAWDAMEVDINAQRQLEGKDPVNFSGPLAINIRRFVDSAGNEGFLGGKGGFYYSASAAAEDICKDPSLIISVDDDAGYVFVKDNALLTADERASGILMAHELGHALFLEHGNGLDDDEDELFDGYGASGGCDTDEDVDAEPFSLMATNTNKGTNVITDLQRDRARIVAEKMPGSHTDPPNILIPGQAFSDHRVDPLHDVTNREVDINSVGMLVNDTLQSTALNHVLFGTIPIEVENQYLVFLDLDNNPATGGMPSSLGFNTSFQGAELVTRVVVTFIPPPAITDESLSESTADSQLVNGFRIVTPTVWRFQSGSFAEISDSGISAQVGTIRDAETGEDRYDVVSILMPNSVRGAITSEARMQAIAEQLGVTSDMELDRLPNTSLFGAVPLFLIHPDFPVCGVDSAEVPQGGAASVEASGLIPGETAKVFIGDDFVAMGQIDDQGNANVGFFIPYTAPTGPRLVTVGVMGTALTADCSVEVTEGAPLDIDVKPGSDPNCINKDNKGRVAIAVLGRPGVDLTEIEAATIRLTDSSSSEVEPVRISTNKDVSDPQDGIKDLVAHFKTSELRDVGMLFTGNELFITGSFQDGTVFLSDSDEIQIPGDSNSSCQ